MIFLVMKRLFLKTIILEMNSPRKKYLKILQVFGSMAQE